MKKNLLLFVYAFSLFLATDSFAQAGRYLTEVFTAVNVSSNIKYGDNISVLTGTPTSIQLMMDVYEPSGDALTARPLIIVLHAGSFLPSIANGLALGKKTDSAVVEMCRRFAKRGYVAVAADYRLGWNALSTNQDVRTGTLLNAVYRALQDAKTCVRFFRNDAATTNTYKIDVNKICVGGYGSGGYVALAYGSLDKTAEINLTKFIDFSQTPAASYVNQAVSGNFDGTDAKPLNNPNHASFSSSINVVFSLAGAAGDSSWIEAGEIPMITMHAYKDPFAPYKTGSVIVPATGQFVVEASGSYDAVRRASRLGNQNVFKNSIFNDVYSTKANSNSPNMPGLYTFITPAPNGASLSCTGANSDAQIEWSAPYDWWNEAVFIASYNAYSSTTNGAVVNCKNKRENPDMSASKGKAYIDTIQGFLNPRLVCAMNLAGCSSTGINEFTGSDELNVYPNPATSEINYRSTGGNKINSITIYEANGRVIYKMEGLNTSSHKVHRQQLKTGLYFTTIVTDNQKVMTKKLYIE